MIRFADEYASGQAKAFVTAFAQTGTQEVKLLSLSQPPGRFETPGTDDMVLGLVEGPRVRARMDFGAGRFQYDSAEMPFFLSPSRTPSIVEADDGHRAHLLTVPQALVVEVIDPQIGGGPERLAALSSRGFRDPFLGLLARQICETRILETGRASLAADCLVANLLARLCEVAGEHAADRGFAGGLAPYQLSRSLELLAADLDRPVRLGELARNAGLSQYHFLRAFKETAGTTPIHFRFLRRMERARSLLAGTQMPIGTIARQVGYDSDLTFGRAFRSRHGVSPQEFRNAVSPAR